MNLKPYALVTMLLVSAPIGLAAQGPGGGGYGGGGGMGGEGMGGRRGGGFQRIDELEGVTVDPVVWNGPPAAGDLPPGMRLTPEQETRYTSLHDQLMTITKRVRDQAQINRDLVYGGVSPDTTNRVTGQGDGSPPGNVPPGGGGYGGDRHHSRPSEATIDDIKQEALYLAQKQDVFDAALESFLSKDQMKEYNKWRKAQRKAAEKAEDKRHEGMSGRRGSPPPS